MTNLLNIIREFNQKEKSNSYEYTEFNDNFITSECFNDNLKKFVSQNIHKSYKVEIENFLNEEFFLLNIENDIIDINLSFVIQENIDIETEEENYKSFKIKCVPLYFVNGERINITTSDIINILNFNLMD